MIRCSPRSGRSVFPACECERCSATSAACTEMPQLRFVALRTTETSEDSQETKRSRTQQDDAARPPWQSLVTSSEQLLFTIGAPFIRVDGLASHPGALPSYTRRIGRALHAAAYVAAAAVRDADMAAEQALRWCMESLSTNRRDASKAISLPPPQGSSFGAQASVRKHHPLKHR